MESLFSRHQNYENAYKITAIKNIPVIAKVDGRNFHRLTKKINKPFCAYFAELMATTALYSAMEIEGCVLAFTNMGEISFVIRNDLNLDSAAWLNNDLQSISSTISSLVTLNFSKNLLLLNFPLNLTGDAIFKCSTFAVPSCKEATNNIISRQQKCFNTALQNSCLYELRKKYSKTAAFKILQHKNKIEKINLLKDLFNKDFELDYSQTFKFGQLVYKVPIIHKRNNKEFIKSKWIYDVEIPDLINDKNFINNIIISGTDIFRQEKDFKIII